MKLDSSCNYCITAREKHNKSKSLIFTDDLEAMLPSSVLCPDVDMSCFCFCISIHLLYINWIREGESQRL